MSLAADLLKPTFALNCRLQIEQVNTYCDDSDVDPLALSLRSLRFLSANHIFSLFHTELLIF